MKRVTKTKIETTIYDTNGKIVSIIRKNITETEPNIILNHEETHNLKERVLVYRDQLGKQLEFSQAFSDSRAKNHKESNKVYQNTHKKPLTERTFRPKAFYHLKMVVEPVTVTSLVWEAANSSNMDPIFQQGPTKRPRRQKR